MEGRDRRQRQNGTEEEAEESGVNWWSVGAGVVGALGAIAAGYYFSNPRVAAAEPQQNNGTSANQRQRSRETPPRAEPQQNNASSANQRQRSREPPPRAEPTQGSLLASVAGMLSALTTMNKVTEDSVSRFDVPRNPDITNLNGLLHDIYVRYIALKKEDFRLHYQVFDEVFRTLHAAMKRSDTYFERYSSTVQFAGSHYDNLRIKKPDEFDMDIVIGLPLCFERNATTPGQSDIVFEPKGPGFVQLKMGTQYQNLPFRDGVDGLINRKPYEWKDDKNYMLRSKFIYWFKGVVQRGLNEIGSQCVVDGRTYRITTTESGPAVTLVIKDSRGFRLDVDLVPSLRFHLHRWPICRGYRSIPPTCRKEYWMVVPKPNKATNNDFDMSRSWRLAFQEQERELMYNSQNLRLTIKLLKKLRDAQGMKKIASYYIKTLFFWEIDQQSESFWRNDPGTLFQHMLVKFHQAMVDKKIPYYWNAGNNLIENVDPGVLMNYARKLNELIVLLGDRSRYREVAKYLLLPDEIAEYRRIVDGV